MPQSILFVLKLCCVVEIELYRNLDGPIELQHSTVCVQYQLNLTKGDLMPKPQLPRSVIPVNIPDQNHYNLVKIL